MTTTINASTTLGLQQTADTSGVLALQTANTTALTLDASQNATFAGYVNAPNTFGFKNRIINGAMMIDQRNAGASVTPTTDSTYTLDRWVALLSASSKYSVQQQTSVVPVGFTNAVKITSLATTSLGAGDYYAFGQRVEGFNIADLNWGSANAKTVTLSFWVYSSLTGTFGGCFGNSAFNRSYPFTYTISAANTWEQKTVTVAGDTSGTWATTNSTGLYIYLGLGVGTTYSGAAGSWTGSGLISATGATSVVGTNGATFYITGVQLEKGSTATSFDYRPYGTELALCQRYYWKNIPSNLYCHIAQGRQESTYVSFIIQYPQVMRSAPTFSISNLAVSIGTIGSVRATYAGNQTALYQIDVSGGTTTGYVNALQQNSAGVGYLDASAEL